MGREITGSSNIEHEETANLEVVCVSGGGERRILQGEVDVTAGSSKVIVAASSQQKEIAITSVSTVPGTSYAKVVTGGKMGVGVGNGVSRVGLGVASSSTSLFLGEKMSSSLGGGKKSPGGQTFSYRI